MTFELWPQQRTPIAEVLEDSAFGGDSKVTSMYLIVYVCYIFILHGDLWPQQETSLLEDSNFDGNGEETKGGEMAHSSNEEQHVNGSVAASGEDAQAPKVELNHT